MESVGLDEEDVCLLDRTTWKNIIPATPGDGKIPRRTRRRVDDSHTKWDDFGDQTSKFCVIGAVNVM